MHVRPNENKVNTSNGEVSSSAMSSKMSVGSTRSIWSTELVIDNGVRSLPPDRESSVSTEIELVGLWGSDWLGVDIVEGGMQCRRSRCVERRKVVEN